MPPIAVSSLLKIAATVALGSGLFLFKINPSLAVQEGDLPAIQPATAPDDGSDPFTNYEIDEESQETAGNLDNADPFTNYESDEPATNESVTDPFTNYESDEANEAKTLTPKTLTQRVPPQQFDRNDLRGDAKPLSAQPRQPLEQSGQLRPASPPPQSQVILTPRLPESRSIPGSQSVPDRMFDEAQQGQGIGQIQRTPGTYGTPENNEINRGQTGNVMVDPALQPATYNAPLPTLPQISPTNAANIAIAQRLLQELDLAGNENSDRGQETGLVDMLTNSNTGNRRSLIKQYWKTWGAWAEYQFAIDELTWIQQVGQVQSEADRSTLDAAQSAANDTIASRALELSHQQHLLNQFISGPHSELMPLPSDIPLVTRYRTNFDLYSTRQSMPEKLRLINEWLPQQQTLIGDRAATVQRCRNAVMQSTRAIAQGRPASSMLQTVELCRNCHSAFVKTLVEYNMYIAEYALAVKPHENAPEQIVAMLIPARATQPINEYDNRTRQATLPDTPYYPSTGQGGTYTPPRSLPGTNGSAAALGDYRAQPATQPPALDRQQFQPSNSPPRSPGAFQDPPNRR